MKPRGNPISRAAAVVLVACLAALMAPLPASAAFHGPLATAVKKCKRKHHGRKRKCRRVTPPAPAPAQISISPSNQDFGMPPPFGKATRIFVVTNTGGSLGGVPVPIVIGPDAGTFAVGANSCIDALPPGATCQIDLDLFPRGAGIVSATLRVVAVPGGTVDAPVTGDIEA
jgi:hypothetical protein